MSRAAGPAPGVRRSAFEWIVSECSLTRLGPSKVLVLSDKAGAIWPRTVPGTERAHLRLGDSPQFDLSCPAGILGPCCRTSVL